MSPNSLVDQLDKQYATAWRPEPGGKLIGVVVDLSEREGFDGNPYPIITVRNENGEEFAAHAFHTVLQNELARIRPAVGDQIGIKYGGQVKSANGRSTYHSYKVRTVGSRTGVNWSRFGDDGDSQADVTETQPSTPLPSKTVQAGAGEQFGDSIPWDD